MRNFIVIISGPTGVGKSDLAVTVAQEVNGNIINADVGQFYTPLTIGTAKPDLSHPPVQHHFFNNLNEPQDFSAYDYRKQLETFLPVLWANNTIPLLVGGSLFYLKSLFFNQPSFDPTPGNKRSTERMQSPDKESNVLWQQLFEFDPIRAKQLHPHDTYRIQRALDIWHKTGKKPSEVQPVYNPICPYIFIFLTRTQQDLYERITHRTTEMINQGWIDEVRVLIDTPWEDFLHTKKIIGYSEIFDYIKQGEQESQKKILIDTIAQKTKNYAKRQLTFWKMFEKTLREGIEHTKDKYSKIYTLDLTLADSTLYIKQLKSIINQMRLYDES